MTGRAAEAAHLIGGVDDSVDIDAATVDATVDAAVDNAATSGRSVQKLA